MNVRESLEKIKGKISAAAERSGRDPQHIQVVAVTKYVSVERTKEALEAGVTHFGESRDEGLLKKVEAIGTLPSWHFIGTLQSRKVKDILPFVDYIHSLDRISLAKEIQKRADGEVNCFVQVNVSGEESKHGLSPEDTLPFIESLNEFSSIKVVGLMAMAPHTDNTNEIRDVFKKLRELGERVQSLSLPHAPCNELSMGMSNDYEIAVEEGATYVRIGSSLVGNEK
ncbi:YggS family pyridoxal phosphate-dependent enzyme [Alkalihalobacillus hwajinpoensis]|uniref:YggS family pyridoxal phosphate-dependent enzyme n=1 Tax=Guptibacillus hwajinpoensis TaxID=208199 RepID=UPI0018836ED7|nr:YggS family pyridoxal phosphate-dependent enzyme [Pseudalkalibacillus hwajinpoensis]MBF0708367.1 YggS family pyridoxal phosphate-dependent enzyme [Pseudalkalibacillus hwajinpoensis]